MDSTIEHPLEAVKEHESDDPVPYVKHSSVASSSLSSISPGRRKTQDPTRRSNQAKKKRDQGGRSPTNTKSRQRMDSNDHHEDTSDPSPVDPPPTNRNGRVKSSGQAFVAGDASDEEGPFLLDLSRPVGGSQDHSDHADADPESGRPRGKSKDCFCIQWLVVALSVMTSYWLNFGLVLVPFPILIYFAGWNRGALFVLTYISIFPLSTFLKTAQISLVKLLPIWAGSITSLLLRNAISLMLGAFAVRDGHVKFVQGLIVGSLIHRLLLILGMSVAIHSKGSKTSKMEDRSARVASSILYMGIVIMIMPSLFMISSPDSGVGGLLKISRWCAIFLLILLGFYFLFSIKTHDKFWDESSLLPMAVGLGPVASTITALIGLAVSIVSSWLVVLSVPYVYTNWGLGYTFVAGILLPLALNAADTIDSVKLAYVSNIKSSTLDAIRACLEVCLYLAPLLVLAGWFSSKAIGLHFAGLVAMSGIISIVNLALLLNALKVTWIQGLMMSVAYLLFAVCYFLQNE